MKKKLKKIIGIIILILIFSGVSFYVGQQIGLNTDTSTTVTTTSDVTVETHTIQKTLTYSGEIQSATTESLSLTTTKYFEMMCVEEDETVSEGDNILQYTDGTYLTAPYDCVVTSYSVPETDAICTSSNYVQIQDLVNLTTSLSISEDDILQVSEGMEVEIVLSADENITYTGTISKINSVATYSSSGSTFAGTVSFTNDGNAKIGMTASLTVILEEATDVVAVPIEAVTTTDSKNYVTVVNGTELVETEIELGIADDEYVEVTSGLSVGDVIQITTTTTQSTIRSTDSDSGERSFGGDMSDFSDIIGGGSSDFSDFSMPSMGGGQDGGMRGGSN